MAKAKVYGLARKYNPRLQPALRKLHKLRPRQRENTTRKPVAAQITKEKEAQA